MEIRPIKVKKKPGLTKYSFDALLSWLHPDRETAGAKYEQIRQTLINIFVKRGCSPAEEMTDEAINRVIGRLDEIKSTYVGDPSLYFYGVAQNILREYSKKIPAQPYIFKQQEPEEDNPDYQCLDECMGELPPESRWLIIEYFWEDKREKINRRKNLAEQLGITHHTLRMRAYRIKAILKKCIIECRKRKGTD